MVWILKKLILYKERRELVRKLRIRINLGIVPKLP